MYRLPQFCFAFAETWLLVQQELILRLIIKHKFRITWSTVVAYKKAGRIRV